MINLNAQTGTETKDFAGNEISNIVTKNILDILIDQKGGNDWNPVGPFGGDVIDVAVNPQNTDIIFAAAGYPFMSEDGGQTWAYMDGLAALAPSGIYTIEVNSNGVVFAGGTFSSYKVFRSIDGGYTWEQKQFSLNRWVMDIAIDPNNPDLIYLGVSGDAAGVNSNAMVKSEDGGDTWSNMDLVGGMPAGYDIVDICIAPDNSQAIIIVGNQSFSNANIAASIDGGSSWTNISSNLPSGKPFNSIAIADENIYVGGGQLFGGNVMGVYKSSNGGSSWTNISNTFPNKVTNDILIDPNDPMIIYVATEGDGIYISEDGGSSWEFDALGAGDNGAARSLAFEPGNTDIIYAGFLSLGVCKSIDAGSNWDYANVGIASLQLNDIEIDQSDQNRVITSFEAENSGGCYISLDGGTSWEIPPTLPGTRYSSVSIGPDGTMYAWSNGPSTVAQEGLYKSDDDGASWTNLGPNIGSVFETEIFSIAISETDPNLIFIGGNNFGANGFASIVYKTENGGESWDQVYLGPEHDSFNYMFIDPNSSDEIVYAAYMSSESHGGFLKSTNTGNSFSDINNGLPTSLKYAGAIVTDPFNQDVLYGGIGGNYGGIDGTIYKSENGGFSWSPTFATLGAYCRVQDLLVNPENTDIVYTATSQQGVMLSTDAGINWEESNSNLPASFVTAFSKPFLLNDSLHIFASTNTHSAFETKLVYDEISTVHSADNSNGLVSVFPNPAMGSSNIQIFLEKGAQVNVNIYNTQGKLIRTLVKDFLSSGNHQFKFNAEKGVYFSETIMDGKTYMNKIIIVE